MTEHDFTRHYVSTFLVVSSSHPNPMEQFQQLNDNLHQLMVFFFYLFKRISLESLLNTKHIQLYDSMKNP